jgi:hypothetical protein
MKRILAVVTAALGLLASTGQATAAPGDDALQLAAAAQAAAGAQAAGAQSGAVQSQPSNRNISVRVLSPGGDGDVTQSNTVGSNATAANANITGQSADQTQSGSCGCSGSGTQATGQEAKSDQSAAAASYAEQSGASNTNIPVRVLSRGDDGDVEQSNTVDSDATAANINATGQSAEQAGGSGTQAVGQEAKSEQDAAAASAAKQKGAENTNISVRVLSPGKNGNVTQSNTAGSSAKAGNLNLTGQNADQGQAGSGGTQAIGQKAKSDQSALALSAAKQDEAQNRNIPVRVLSPGKGGDVTQSNSVGSKATAGNLNATKQDADQGQGGSSKCGCASDGSQAIGQEAKNEQSAGALSAAFQSGASNTNAPVRIDSKGGDGDVTQSNSVGSRATALNINLTGQKADQAQGSGDCYCASGGTQAIGQEAKSDQSAAAASLAAQLGGRDKCGCGSSGNTNAPVRIGSYGGGGSVEQSNDVGSSAGAGNLNLTGQTAGQGQGGSGTQAIGQEAKSDQDALALSAALQSGPSNTNAPVRVDSKGSDGDVTQSNTAGSRAAALNGNLTKQDADQGQRGSTCGCDSTAVQAIGQQAKNEQGAGAFSLALQQGARNENTPVRVGSYGGGGSVEQSNNVGSSSTAVNLNALKQDADQSQAGGGGIAIQAIGQKAKNEQAATGLSVAIQSGASNSSTPVVVGGSKGYDKKGRGCTCRDGKGHYDKGHYGRDGKDYGHKSRESGGSVSQSNNVGSAAKALNVNLLHQGSTQRQDGGRCGCHKGVGIQASGQSAKSSQGALAASLGLQCGARNGGKSAESHYGSEPRAYSKPRKEGYC